MKNEDFAGKYIHWLTNKYGDLGYTIFTITFLGPIIMFMAIMMHFGKNPFSLTECVIYGVSGNVFLFIATAVAIKKTKKL